MGAIETIRQVIAPTPVERARKELAEAQRETDAAREAYAEIPSTERAGRFKAAKERLEFAQIVADRAERVERDRLDAAAEKKRAAAEKKLRAIVQEHGRGAVIAGPAREHIDAAVGAIRTIVEAYRALDRLDVEAAEAMREALGLEPLARCSVVPRDAFATPIIHQGIAEAAAGLIDRESEAARRLEKNWTRGAHDLARALEVAVRYRGTR